MESDTQVIKAVTSFLNERSFSVERIAEGDGKTPDLRATDKAGIVYLIEVKTKIDDQDFVQRRNRKLAEGGVFEDNRRLEPSNTLSGNIADAAGQLAAFPEKAFRIVFYICTGARSANEKDSLVSTLYGRVYLHGMGISYTDSKKPRNSYNLPCYYFRESSFFTHRDSIDATAILWPDQSNHQMLLCLNDYSSNYEDLKKSDFRKMFTRHGVIDPKEEEDEKEAMSFREEFDRNDEKGVIMRLHEKYDDRTLQIINMEMTSATIAVVPKDE